MGMSSSLVARSVTSVFRLRLFTPMISTPQSTAVSISSSS